MSFESEFNQDYNKLLTFFTSPNNELHIKKYLSLIFDSLAGSQNEVDFLAFYNYISLPYFIAEKIFSCLAKKTNKNLSLLNFIDGLYSLYYGNLATKIEFLLYLLDLNDDGYIYFDNVKLFFIHLHSIGNCFNESDIGIINTMILSLFEEKTKLSLKNFTSNILTKQSDIFFLFYYIIFIKKPFNVECVNHYINTFSNYNNNSKENNNLHSHKTLIIQPSNELYEYLNRNFDGQFSCEISEIEQLLIFEKDLTNVLTNNYEKNQTFIQADSNQYNESDSTTSRSITLRDTFTCFNVQNEKIYLDFINNNIFLYQKIINKSEKKINYKLLTIININNCLYVQKQKGNMLSLISTIKNIKKEFVFYFESCEEAEKAAMIIKKISGNRNISDFYLKKKKIESGIIKGQNLVTKKEIIIKKIQKDYNIIEDLRLAYSERDIAKFLIKIYNEGIGTIIDIFENADSIYIVQEYVQSGNLKNFILDNPNLSQEIIANLFGQILSSLVFLHSNGIVHRDLKIENVLIKKLNSNKYQSKIIDFGISRVLSKNECLQAKYGTFANLPPEIIKNEPYSHNIDVWNLGIIGYFMLSKKHPYNSTKIKTLEKKIISENIDLGEIEKQNENNKLIYILKKCLEKNKFIRPDSDDLIKYLDYL